MLWNSDRITRGKLHVKPLATCGAEQLVTRLPARVGGALHSQKSFRLCGSTSCRFEMILGQRYGTIIIMSSVENQWDIRRQSHRTIKWNEAHDATTRCDQDRISCG